MLCWECVFGIIHFAGGWSETMGHLRNVRRIPATALGLLFAAPAFAQEGFDQNGSDWSVTIFADIIASGGGTFERAALAEGQGAPNTSPPLPINQDGDKEGRYFEATQAPSYSVALTTWSAALLDGFVGIGNADSSASQSVGFLAQRCGRSEHAGTRVRGVRHELRRQHRRE